MLAAWSGLGYNRRALALQAAAAHVAEHGWPDDLTALPGVGPYTAAAVGVVRVGPPGRRGRHQRAPRVERWTARARRPRRSPSAARRCSRAGARPTFNQAMMELGATVCRAARAALRRLPGRATAARGGGGRAAPRAGAERFEDTDRWARGRVVAALLAGEPLPPDVDDARSSPGSSGTG